MQHAQIILSQHSKARFPDEEDEARGAVQVQQRSSMVEAVRRRVHVENE